MILTKTKAFPIVLAAALSAAVVLPLVKPAIAQNPPPAAGQPAAPAGQPAPAAAPAAAPAPAVDPKKVPPETVVVQIGDEKLTAKQFGDFLNGLPQQYQQMAEQDPAVRRQLADSLVRVRLLSREARKRGLDKTDRAQVLLALAQDQVLAQALADQMISDDAIKAHLAQNNDWVTARHILISTRATPGSKPLTDEEAKKKADSIRARIEKGEDFAALAKAESDDPGSKDIGGVYTFPRQQMVKEFEDTAFGLKENELSQPVKTAFGYHVIQRLAPDMKQLRPQIEQKLAPKKMDDLVSELKKTTPTTLNPDYFGAPPAPAPVAPATAVPAPGTPGAAGAAPPATPK